MPRTGEFAPQTGKYASDCGPEWTVRMRVGEELPPCPHCHRAVNYTFLS